MKSNNKKEFETKFFYPEKKHERKKNILRQAEQNK